MLDIILNWNPKQYQEKLMMQTWENGKNLISSPILGPIFFLCVCVSLNSTSS